MKQIYSLYLFIAFCFAMCTCSDEQLVEIPNQSGVKEGELVDASLCISVDGFQVSVQGGARANEDDLKGIDAENTINDIWVFQFNASGAHLYTQYLSSEVLAQNNLSNLPVKLIANVQGSSSIIYAVTNVGDKWVSDGETLTLDELKQKTLPSSGPQVPDLISGYPLIPMEGRVKETVFVSTGSKIVVSVTRVFAKLMISITSNSSMSLKSLEVANILQSCKVQSLQTESTLQGGVPYENVYWTNRSLRDYNDIDNSHFIIYVPENIHGVKTLEEGQTKNDIAPSRALALNLLFDCKLAQGQDDTFYNGFTEERSYTVYPGMDIEKDFNIKRNHIYKIKINVKDFDSEANEPSSNCFVVPVGGAIAFEPYNRIETGGGYNIKTYLDPTAPSKAIVRADIIWQYEGTIGDNTDGSRVRYNDKTKKIYVKTNAVGNALIGAYNADNQIIWSWHIWVTDIGHDPANLGSQLKYNTYAWDEGGIRYDEPRVEGRAIMPCNLGALANWPEHSRDTKTFGMLYQWGRKDPFPPVRHYTGHMPKAAYTNSDTRSGYTAGIGKLYDESNVTEVGITSEHISNSLFHSLPGNGREGLAIDNPILYSIHNPTVFMCGTKEARDMRESPDLLEANNYIDGANGNWAKLIKDDGKPMDDLWGGRSPTEASQYYMISVKPLAGIANNYEGTTKSIFDPCPKGWRVPPGELWLGFTKYGVNPKSLDEVYYRPNEYDEKNGMALCIYRDPNNEKNNVTSYFPTQGTRTPDGWINQIGQCGNYHNGTTDRNERVNILHVHESAEYFKVFEYTWYFYYVKSVGGPIRCVRDSDTK